ncbi:Crp/Fnr family transcriptional regulator [Roseibium sediminicola]|uniref:Crp/Fnr family transcriptional regulator n=1 Tax=Roseibium sediminicola TaxID=2933272 RepID=A0ABT0GW18_9HYPH|nr:Crp/Fnr family transcriptional regulator [Roseibium sp. CAU 1639]MCK7613643.1 Crp/Fnr family transcriptional regulator [Roseibium sp. CAU 1639]
MNTDGDLKKEKLLGKSFIFDALDDQARQELANFSYVKRYAAGDKIFTMGEPGQSMMAIAEGTVRVTMFTPSDREVTLNDLQAGDVFGEIAMLDGQERSANVKALTNCTLVVLERRALLDVLQRNPILSVRLIELLCQRVRRSDERMIEIAFLDLPARLAKLLLRLTVAPPASEEKPLAKLSQSQSELASMIGNTRENVNRCLRKWQKAELINLQDGWLIIRDRDRLEALAHGE